MPLPSAFGHAEPDGHVTHEEEPAAEYVPAVQERQSVDPVVSSDVYFPATHVVHSSAEEDEALPASHVVQLLWVFVA
jgi:hypothetical protein